MIIIMFGAGHGNWYAHNAQNIAIFVRMYFKFTGLRGSFLSPGKNVFLRAHVRVLVIGHYLAIYFDGRRTSTILCSRSRCGAREALTVGYQPTTIYCPTIVVRRTYNHYYISNVASRDLLTTLTLAVWHNGMAMDGSYPFARCSDQSRALRARRARPYHARGAQPRAQRPACVSTWY